MIPYLTTSLRLLAATALLGHAASAAAQVVQIKTVPVAAGEQFLIHPSANRGLAGVSVAIDDPLLDAFRNPALGAQLTGSRVFTAPAYYSVANDNGSGRTLPLGGLLAGREWFGTASIAFQQLHPPSRWRFCCFPMADVAGLSTVPPREQSADAVTNLFASGSLGRRLAGGRTSVGVGASHARLRGVDGVDLLYAASESVRQSGGMTDVRAGLSRDLGGDQRLDLLLLHQRVDVVHEVRYADVFWTTEWVPVVTWREEVNRDQTRVWGAQAGYTRRLDDEGWRGGATGTMNYMRHPKIPNYELMNIPRDPGHSWAYNLGAGVGRREGPVRVGVEVIYEPIWSRTWAETEEEIDTPGGGTISAGGRTVENDFRFNNSHVRIGAGREDRLGFQLGLHVRSISYTLDQQDFRTSTRREQKESWMEWTPTWGLSLHFPEIEVRYTGRYVSGTGRPGVALTGMADAASLTSSYILAPSGPLTLGEAGVLSHQVAVSLPVGRR
jgi:hypothetical protein